MNNEKLLKEKKIEKAEKRAALRTKKLQKENEDKRETRRKTGNTKSREGSAR